MPAILKIGHSIFLVKSESSAIAAIKALGDAVEVERDWDRNTGQEFYVPSESRAGERSLVIIRPCQLRRAKHGKEPEPAREVKQLDFNGKVHYQDGGVK